MGPPAIRRPVDMGPPAIRRPGGSGPDDDGCRHHPGRSGAAGMGTAWVTRRRDPPEAIGPTPEIEARSLSGVVDAVLAD
jgi:hypothetical protein